jgi:hypothetical protein
MSNGSVMGYGAPPAYGASAGNPGYGYGNAQPSSAPPQQKQPHKHHHLSKNDKIIIGCTIGGTAVIITAALLIHHYRKPKQTIDGKAFLGGSNYAGGNTFESQDWDDEPLPEYSAHDTMQPQPPPYDLTYRDQRTGKLKKLPYSKWKDPNTKRYAFTEQTKRAAKGVGMSLVHGTYLIPLHIASAVVSGPIHAVEKGMQSAKYLAPDEKLPHASYESGWHYDIRYPNPPYHYESQYHLNRM